MHVLGPDTPEEIVEKTGGGAGFTTYIALNQAHHVGLFVAFTDGPSHNHFNVFKAANNVVLQLSGLPPLPPEPTRVVKPVHRAVRKRTAVSH
jgi:D-alanyl-D-alanine-carboxypeptidase/D-alanyl-D-alanine-endopeptidase